MRKRVITVQVKMFVYAQAEQSICGKLETHSLLKF